jgi:hypothetical protein
MDLGLAGLLFPVFDLGQVFLVIVPIKGHKLPHHNIDPRDDARL